MAGVPYAGIVRRCEIVFCILCHSMAETAFGSNLPLPDRNDHKTADREKSYLISQKKRKFNKKSRLRLFFLQKPEGGNHGSVKSNMTVQMEFVKRLPAKISARSRSKNQNIRMNRDCFLRQAPVRRHHRADAGKAPRVKTEADAGNAPSGKKIVFFQFFILTDINCQYDAVYCGQKRKHREP